MPTVIAVDVSLSMAQPVVLDSGETFTKLQLAIHGINTLLDYLSLYCKLEFVSVVAFSSSCEVISHFSRDFDQLKLKLNRLEECDKQDIETAFLVINSVVLSEWDTSTPCQVILITDGDTQPEACAVPFSFPGKMAAVVLSTPGVATPHLRRLVECCGLGDAGVLMPDAQLLTPACVHQLFLDLAHHNYSSFTGLLKCGHLNCKVILCPPPIPYTKTTDFDLKTMSVTGQLEIMGFLEVAQLGSPAAVSRHLVLPHPGSGSAAPLQTAMSHPESDDDNHDEGIMPSFCVLLHGAMKVENMAALCKVGDDWYGVLYSWADSKKKSNLMLTLLEPGTNSVPWLGNLKHLGVPSDPENPNPEEMFPCRPAEKRSYSQNCVVWIRQTGLQSDIQKILRHARKLPEKTTFFYKELNRVRRAAISLGFISLLDCLAAILERECLQLPGTAHPDCALQLTHAAGVLRQPYSRDPKYNIMPMHTKYTDTD